MEDAIWLLEYVSKTKGAHHLKLSTRNLNIIQYFNIDVIIFILFLLKIQAITYQRIRRVVKSRKIKTE